MSLLASRRKRRRKAPVSNVGGESKSSAVDNEDSATPMRAPREAVVFRRVDAGDVPEFLQMLGDIKNHVEMEGSFEQRVALCMCYLLHVNENLALQFYENHVDWNEPQQTADIAQQEIVKHFDSKLFNMVFGGEVMLDAGKAQDTLSSDSNLSSSVAACVSMLQERIDEIETANRSARGNALTSAYDMLLNKMKQMKTER